MARGMKLYFDGCFAYDCVFSWMAIIATCVVMDDDVVPYSDELYQPYNVR